MALDVISGTAVINSGTSLSSIVSLSEAQVLTLWLPTAWTAATISLVFLGPDGVERTLGNEDGEVAVAASASRVVVLTGALIPAGVRGLRVRSGSSGSPVNQAAERTILVSARRFG